MKSLPVWLTFLVVSLAAASLPADVSAQMFTYERDRSPTMTTLGPALHVVDFNASGENGLLSLVSYSAPAYGIHLTRPGFAAYFAYGTATSDIGDDARDIRLIDASITIWSGMELVRRGGTRLMLPIALHSGYRGIDERDTGPLQTRSFDLTTLGIGSGLVFDARPADRIAFEARGLPMLGLAIRSFEGAAGSTMLVDVDVQAHLLNLIDDFGISIGYAFRAQRWSVDVSVLAGDERDRFTGLQHTMRVTLNW